MTYNGQLSGPPTPPPYVPGQPGSLPPMPEPLSPPLVQSAADVVLKAIARAKGEITGQQELEEIKSPVERVLEGLGTLCEASNGAFSYTVLKQTPEKLEVATDLEGRAKTIRLNGYSVSLGRGFFRGYMTPEMMLADVAKKAVTQGMLEEKYPDPVAPPPAENKVEPAAQQGQPAVLTDEVRRAITSVKSRSRATPG